MLMQCDILRCCSGEPELAVATHVLKRPISVYDGAVGSWGWGPICAGCCTLERRFAGDSCCMCNGDSGHIWKRGDWVRVWPCWLPLLLLIVLALMPAGQEGRPHSGFPVWTGRLPLPRYTFVLPRRWALRLASSRHWHALPAL